MESFKKGEDKMLFKNLKIGQFFWYEDECYSKTGETRAFGFNGGKEFNLGTEVEEL